VSEANVCIVQHGAKESGPGDPGLSALGRAHAIATAQHLRLERWDVLYSSPLRRAYETATFIGESCDLDVVSDEGLRERMNWGNEPNAQDASTFLADWAHATADRSWVPPSGDSSEATGRRMRAAIEERVQHREHRIIVVSHGGATTDLLRSLFSDRTLRSVAPSIIDDGVASCGLTRLLCAGREWQLIAVAARSHLPADDAQMLARAGRARPRATQNDGQAAFNWSTEPALRAASPLWAREEGLMY
jgi:broad specificity phosphatase PhoE